MWNGVQTENQFIVEKDKTRNNCESLQMKPVFRDWEEILKLRAFLKDFP